MTDAWHWFVVIVTLVNIAACVWLIMWASPQGDADKAEMDTLDHVWDENLCERNNPLPRWWLYLFVGSIVWGIGYLIWYPGLGSFAGLGGWSQIAQYEAERDAVDARYRDTFARLAQLDLHALGRSDEGMDIAGRLFAANCATCHGADARGARGFPNLTDQDWQWGAGADAITLAIRDGRQGVMPAWGEVLGERGVRETVAYVKQLSGLPYARSLAEQGQRHYANLCAACHGADGRGQQALGAPNLTDKASVYGRDDDALAHSIAHGRNGMMPAHADLLSADEIKLLTAYVLSLGASGGADGGR